MLRYTPEQERFVIGNWQAFNERQIALAKASGQMLIGNALPVPYDVWKSWDAESVTIQKDVLAVFNDLAGSVSQPMPIGKLINYFRTVSDSGEVNVSLDGRSKALTDQQVYDYHGTPLPIIDSTFSYGWRQMAAAASEGFALDSDGRDNANRKVAEKLEDIVLNGDAKIVVDGNQLYGLLNHPKRNTDTHGFDLNGATGPNWLTAVNKALKKQHDANYRVAATLYVNWDDWFYAGNTDYSTTYASKTIAQRVLENAGVANVVPSSSVAANTIIAVVKNRRVLQLLNGMPMSTRAQFRANPEDDYNFVTMAASALQIKWDADNQCGVTVVTKV